MSWKLFSVGYLIYTNGKKTSTDISLSHLDFCISGWNYKKVVHFTDPEAKCLDGSPPAIYVHQGTEKDKFMIFLQGGGYCQGGTQA